jgi:DNA-binding winged helix-turn-helix (wHTH) protein
MIAPSNRLKLAGEPDFKLGELTISPSSCRVLGQGSDNRVEAQTMAVLVVLAKAEGATVSRDDLVEACWQGRIVSDDAIARAIAKVRALARGVIPPAFVIETVPKVGYRLRVEPRAATSAASFKWPAPPLPARRQVALVALAAAVAVPLVWGALAVGSHPPTAVPSIASSSPTSLQVLDALLNVDEARLEHYLRIGWNPNWHLDSERNAALHNLMMACERNPAHDRESVRRVAQLLVAYGASPATQNKWGDTPLIIAREPRYCGPNHPVVAYLQSLDSTHFRR